MYWCQPLISIYGLSQWESWAAGSGILGLEDGVADAKVGREEGAWPARTKAFNKCNAITASTCLGAASSARSSNIISNWSCNSNTNSNGNIISISNSNSNRSCSCSLEFQKPKPNGPAGEQLNCHLSFPELLIAGCRCCSSGFSICHSHLAHSQQLATCNSTQCCSPQIFKCCSCDFSWTPPTGVEWNGMESLGLERVSNDCGLRRRRRWRWRPDQARTQRMMQIEEDEHMYVGH